MRPARLIYAYPSMPRYMVDIPNLALLGVRLLEVICGHALDSQSLSSLPFIHARMSLAKTGMVGTGNNDVCLVLLSISVLNKFKFLGTSFFCYRKITNNMNFTIVSAELVGS